MTRTRWTGLAGAAFGLLLLAIAIVVPTTPSNGGSGGAEKYVRFWSDDDHQSKARLAAFLMTYGCLLLVAFAAGLRDRFRDVDAGALPSFILAAGTASAALLLAGAMTGLSVGITAVDAPSFKLDGSLAMLLDTASYGMMGTGLMLAAAMAVAVGLLTLRTRLLPAWTAWLGFLLGLSAVGSLFTAWVGFLGLPLWTVVIGLVLLLRGETVADGPGAPLAA